MNAMKGRGVLGGFALGVVTTLGALALGSANSARATKTPGLSREAFHRAIDDVLDRYVDRVDEPELLARGLEQVVAGLDPHSHYLSAEERKRLRRRGRAGSLGASVLLRDDGATRALEVVAVEPGSAAAAADLHPGDHILSIEGTEVAQLLSQVQAEAMLTGKVGQKLALRVQRRDEPKPTELELELARHRFDPVEVDLRSMSGDAKVAVVRIRGFSAGTGEEVKRGLARARRKAGSRGLSAIVLDLRNNPGGAVDEALVVADLFVERGVLTRTRGRGGRILREEVAHEAGTDTQTSLVVVQDRHTASAAELLAVALQEHGRAKIVGERSYGKGTVQEVMGLEDGSVITLTIARYFSPDDHMIDGIGVEPDVSLVLHPDDPSKGLQAALDTLGLTPRR